jgi:hypothetical protein
MTKKRRDRGFCTHLIAAHAGMNFQSSAAIAAIQEIAVLLEANTADRLGEGRY